MGSRVICKGSPYISPYPIHLRLRPKSRLIEIMLMAYIIFL